jgi:hypothetical protein
MAELQMTQIELENIKKLKVTNLLFSFIDIEKLNSLTPEAFNMFSYIFKQEFITSLKSTKKRTFPSYLKNNDYIQLTRIAIENEEGKYNNLFKRTAMFDNTLTKDEMINFFPIITTILNELKKNHIDIIDQKALKLFTIKQNIKNYGPLIIEEVKEPLQIEAKIEEVKDLGLPKIQLSKREKNKILSELDKTISKIEKLMAKANKIRKKLS